MSANIYSETTGKINIKWKGWPKKEPSSHIIGIKTEKKLSQAVKSEMVFLNGRRKEMSHNVYPQL